MAAQAKYYVSQDLHRLVARLHENLREDYALLGDPFTPARVLVPNRNLKRWIFMRLADPDVNEHGAAANIQFQFLEKGIEDMLRTLDKTDDPGRLLTRRDSVLAVLGAFDRYEKRYPPSATGGVDPMLEYLAVHPRETPSGRAKRLYNMALRFASLFQEYEYHRPEWVEHWRARAKGRPEGTPAGREPVFDAEQRLYTIAYGDRFDRGLVSFLPDSVRVFAEYAARVLERAGKQKAGAPVHVFGTAQISRFHVELLTKLSAYFPLRFYLLDIYPELGAGKSDWRTLAADVPFRPSSDKTDFFGPPIPKASHPLLSAWSIPARHTLALLFDRAPAKARWYVDKPRPAAETLLGRLQANILSGKGTLPHKSDRSLQVAGCPSAKREIETVFHSILRNAAEDAQLRLTDIAVIVPDMRRYKPVIQSVFDSAVETRPGKESGLVIPYNLTDFSAGDESTFAEGAAALFDIIGSRFTRADLFRLFLNPCFLARWKLSRSDVMLWLDWAENLHLYRGFAPAAGEDASHESRLYTWTLASLRLRLGRIMNPEAQFDDIVPFQDIASGDGELLSAFTGVTEELARAAEDILALEQTDPGRLCAAFASLLDRFLSDPPDRPEEGIVREGMRETLAWLERAAPMLEVPLSLTLIREFLEDGNTTIPASRGTYLSGGVTISEMQPMRPLPFRIVYLCGLNESVFPGRSETSVLNLRSDAPRTGDAERGDMNRLLFLENVVSVQEKLYITYVSRDLERDRELEPSSVVRELVSFCAEEGLTLPIHKLPLLKSDPRLFNPSEPEDCDLFYSYSELERQTAIVRKGAKEERRPAAAYLKKGRQFQTAESSAEGTGRGASSPEGVVALEDLREFLLRPFDAVMRARRLHDETADERIFEGDEPLQAGYPESYTLPALVIRQGLCAEEWDEDSGRALLAGYFAEEQKKGALPRGAFGRAGLEDMAETLIPLVGAMRSAAGGKRITYVSFSDGAATEAGDVRHAPLRQTVRLRGAREASVRLVSRGEFMAGSDFVVWTAHAPSDADCVRPFLVHAALAGSGVESPRNVFIFGGDKSKSYAFKAVSKKDADAYLALLMEQFLDGDVSFLPFSLVGKPAKAWEGPPAGPGAKERYVRELIAAYEDDSFRALSFTPMSKILQPVFPDNAYDVVRARWKPFYDHLEKIGERRRRT
ncbi:MAG: exodeoxyribonuclease V subunit gamma [Spirochaetia bacterium]|nr:exodeoxyribonuclease V subunit gamma [Spirochaetia bacterium]